MNHSRVTKVGLNLNRYFLRELINFWYNTLAIGIRKDFYTFTLTIANKYDKAVIRLAVTRLVISINDIADIKATAKLVNTVCTNSLLTKRCVQGMR